MASRRHNPPRGRYVENRVPVRVRFQEVDSLRVVWHGHYLSYFEDARVALGKAYGIGYHDLMAEGLTAPIVHASCDFFAPARFDDELEVVARLYERPSAKLEFYYEVWRRADSTLLAAGETVQVFADHEGALILTMPEFMRAFYGRWADSMVQTDE